MILTRESSSDIWFACDSGDARVLCPGGSQSVVDSGVRRRLCIGFDLRLPPRRLAFRAGGSRLESGRVTAVVVKARMTGEPVFVTSKESVEDA